MEKVTFGMRILEVRTRASVTPFCIHLCVKQFRQGGQAEGTSPREECLGGGPSGSRGAEHSSSNRENEKEDPPHKFTVRA